MLGEYSDQWVQYQVYDDHDQPISDKYLSPTNSISKKPIQRRSRASKKTPTTLLNANTANFRALVQQFTGCRHSPTTISFAAPRKGPVNLNFAADYTTNVSPGQYDYDYELMTQTAADQPQHHHQPDLGHRKMHHFQEQQSGCLFDSNIPGDHNYTSGSSGYPTPDMRLEEFSVLENMSLHELIGEYA
ncbi:hypothetical protein Vadar_012930 [Vaccinium darrowii]|uniref:Uncharacterized protein n=1 Tax=Vaccinium darrowii TaxID=229202 RepID=A0ACB7X961_9ERIC|nr:hypothetical protein Vadar_012930 [Vaccinium darrowii]